MSIAACPYRESVEEPPRAGRPRPLRAAVRALVIHQADVVRLGVSTMLITGSACEVDTASSVHEALRLAGAAHPQLVLFDYGALDGAEVCRLLTALWPRPRVIALASHESGVAARDCLAAGADAAVQIDRVRRETFLEVVRQVLDGRTPVVAGFPPPGSPNGHRSDGPGGSGLTPREREMLYLIGQGLSNREIAEALVLSVKTVEGHRANLSRKLNVRSRAGLMRVALTGEVTGPGESTRGRLPLTATAELPGARDLPGGAAVSVLRPQRP